MRDVFIGRQAIYNADKSVFGYELLFRSADTGRAQFSDDNRATSEVILNAFTVFGLDELAGSRPVFVNVTEGFLDQLHALPLPAERLIIELHEDTEPTDTVIRKLRSLRQRGVRLALDDYVHHPRLAPLVALADYVKVELPAYTDTTLPPALADLRRSRAVLLAEKVESLAQFEACRAAGFELFQGFFLSRPENIRSTDLPSGSLTLLDVLAGLQQSDISAGELEELINRDAGLSYKLLRYLNSPHFPIRREIDSIRRAIVYLGTEELRRWAALMLLGAADRHPGDVALSIMIRARFTELLARQRTDTRPGLAFMAGLLSGLDVLLDTPMPRILERLPLEPRLAAAITEHSGPEGELLDAAIAYEHGDCSPLAALDLPAPQTNAAYVDAVRWGEGIRALW